MIYGSRTTESDTYSEIKTLVEWVSVAEQDLFRETISEHFNTEYLFRYFLMVLLIGAVDSLGKNMKIMTVDGKVWYPTFYDMDFKKLSVVHIKFSLIYGEKLEIANALENN